ncbi:MAG TPA: hypothetical protein H9818_06865, partial [Candidatus Phocaeicola gallistercoris]|nr:hypothetical protein [Candidatus Phocaeicola gallistercoris]
ADTVINLTEHYTVPEGKTLIIKEGVQIIASTEGVGANLLPVEFTVNGNLYCEGTEEKPVLFSIPEADRPEANTFAGLWGGIVAGSTCEEMLIDHAIIEYTGGDVLEGAPAANAGYYEAGDDAYPQITTNNVNGKYVITNSILRNGVSDAIYMMGGNAIIMNNLFIANGETGEEAVNVKSGCQVDVAGNVMYAPNTNALKLSSSDQSDVRGQAKIQAYNNTIINAGWRRDSDKGGGIYAEENVAVHVYNNLLVNCKFRAMTPGLDNLANVEGGYDDRNSVIDYNYYASGSQEVDPNYVYEQGIHYSWQGYNYEHEDYHVGVVDVNSVIATEEDSKDPMFVNYDIDAISLTNYVYNDAWNFHLQAGSPALHGAYNGGNSAMAPLFGTVGLSVNGKTFTSPDPQAYFGAHGVN